MSFLSRLHKIVNAAGGAIHSIASIPTDIAQVAMNSEEYDGFVNGVYDMTRKRVQGYMAGATGTIGGVIGSVPEPVRAVPRFFVREGIQEPIKNISEVLETVWREGISEPITTTASVATIADIENDPMAWVRGKTWSQGYKIAQHRSPGQAIDLAINRVNIADEAELASHIGSRGYQLRSGTVDLALRFFADPTVIGGKIAKATRLAKITKPLNEPAQLKKVLDDPEILPKFNQAITDIKKENPSASAAIIRDRIFPDHPDGAEIAGVLVNAPTQKEQYLALRAFAGDHAAYQTLVDTRSRIAHEVGSLNKQVEDLAPIRAAQPYHYNGTVVLPDTPGLFHSSPGGATVPGAGNDDILRAELIGKISRYDAIDARLERATKAYSTLRETPRFRAFESIPAIGEVRTSITRSDFYQESALAPALHRIFDMKPASMITAKSKNGDIQLDRLMKNANLPLERREALRAQYIKTTNKELRRDLAVEIETESIAHMASQAGLSVDEVADVIARISNNRSGAMAALAKRERQAQGHSTSYFEGEDGVMQAIDHPTWITDDDLLIPLVDIAEVKHALSRIGEYRARFPRATGIPVELMQGFYRLWKPAVLIRPAWTVRVVGDEQLRILSIVGAMTHFRTLVRHARDYTTDYIHTPGKLIPKSDRTMFGVRNTEYRGLEIESAYGIHPDMVRHQKELISSANQFAAAVGDKSTLYLQELRRTAAETMKTIYPDDKGYKEAYDYAAKRLRSSPIGAQILARKSEDEIVDWLHSTPEGLSVLRSNSVKAHNARNWVKVVSHEIDKYTNGNEDLFDLMGKGKATHADLVHFYPEAAEHPFVHAELLNQAIGEGFFSKTISAFTERAFRMFGKTPTDAASRNPFFDEVYQAEVRRRIDLTLGQGATPTPELMKIIAQGSREYADQQVKFHLYDLAESSQLGEMARFLSPFFNAWREVFTRWAGLTIQNPPFVARARMAFSAPDKAGLVTDEKGREVIWGQEYSDDPLADNYRGKDRYITLPLPDWLKNAPGMSGIVSKGSVAFNKKSFSMIMALPGFGPPAQLLVNEYVKDRPDIADTVKFILPIGPTQKRRDLFIPAGMKRAISLGTEDQGYLNDKIRIMMDRVTKYNEEHGDFAVPTPEEADAIFKDATKEAQAYYMLRIGSALTLPAAASYRSPYTMYMNALNQARTRYYADPTRMALKDSQGNSRTPDEWFLDEYGKEFFNLTQAVTKTMDGIPASLEAWAARKENKVLVERYAELGLGGLIIGEDSGEFNALVAQLQRKSELRPGSSLKQREPISFEDAAKDPQRRLGWIEYRRAMDVLEATRVQRGLPNLQVAAAGDLAFAKQQVTEYLKKQYPAWADDFNQTDKGKWEKKIAALRDISSRPEMKGRPDMQGIREYMEVRDEMTKILAGRKKAGGASTLTASTNADLAAAWNATTGYLIRTNLAFQAVFYQHLENDPLGL